MIVTTKIHDRLDAAYLEKKYRVFVEEGGSRSSKTHSIIQFWIKYAARMKGREKRIIISRKKATWLVGTVVKDFIDALKAYGLYNKRNHKQSTGAGIYRLYTTEFWFLGLDDPQRIHGMKSDGIWINEAVEANKDDFDQLFMRCSGIAILDYNPSYEEHWIYDSILKRKDAFYDHSTMLDNPFNPDNVINQILGYEPTDANYKQGTADKRKWKIYGLGQRASIEGLVFEKDVHWDIVQEIPAWAKQVHHRWGLDWGYTNNPTAIADIYWTGNDNEVYIDQLCYKTNMLNPEIGQVLKDSKLVGVKGYADSNELKSIEEIHNMGFNVHGAAKPPGSVWTGIDIMKRYKFHITERSINFIQNWRNYTWQQDKNNVWLNEPVKKDDHAIDATRYVFFMEFGWKPDRTQKSTKSGLGFY